MQIADRTAFKAAFARLCAAFNTPPTQVREDAYFRAFDRQTLGQFERLVDLALRDGELAEMPTVGVLRGLPFKQSPQPLEAQTGPSIQERLVAFAAPRMHGKLNGREFSLPWSYTYRQWKDGTGARAAECTGLKIFREDGTVLTISVADLQAPAA